MSHSLSLIKTNLLVLENLYFYVPHFLSSTYLSCSLNTCHGLRVSEQLTLRDDCIFCICYPVIFCLFC